MIGKPQHQVASVRTAARSRARWRRRAEQAHAVERAAACERRQHARHRARVAVAVGGRDLRPPPGASCWPARVAASGCRSPCRAAIRAPAHPAPPRRSRPPSAATISPQRAILGSAETDVEVGAERPRHLVAEERPERSCPRCAGSPRRRGSRTSSRGTRSRCPAPTTASRAASAATSCVPIVQRLERQPARRIAARPAVWLSSMRTGIVSLPAARELRPVAARRARRGRAARDRPACARRAPSSPWWSRTR